MIKVSINCFTDDYKDKDVFSSADFAVSCTTAFQDMLLLVVFSTDNIRDPALQLCAADNTRDSSVV